MQINSSLTDCLPCFSPRRQPSLFQCQFFFWRGILQRNTGENCSPESESKAKICSVPSPSRRPVPGTVARGSGDDGLVKNSFINPLLHSGHNSVRMAKI